MDYVLPSFVIALKIGFRLLIDHAFEGIELLKAVISLPVDIVFLSFSFSAIVLQTNGFKAAPFKEIMVFTMGSILAGALVTVLSKRADEAHRNGHRGLTLGLTFGSYIVAVLIVCLSLNVTRMV